MRDHGSKCNHMDLSFRRTCGALQAPTSSGTAAALPAGAGTSNLDINPGGLTNTQPCLCPAEGKARGEKQQSFSGSEKGYLDQEREREIPPLKPNLLLGLGGSHGLLFPKWPFFPLKKSKGCAQGLPLRQGLEPVSTRGARGSAHAQGPCLARGEMCWQTEPGRPSPSPYLWYVDLFQASRLHICTLEIKKKKKKNQATTSRVPEEEVSDSFHPC